MDWNEFFETTRKAAKAESYSKLAPMIGISDGAISHYRTGKRVPSAWVVANALRIQHHPEPEKEAARLLQRAAGTSEERAFWRKLVAGVAVALAMTGFAAPVNNAVASVHSAAADLYIMRSALLGRSGCSWRFGSLIPSSRRTRVMDRPPCWPEGRPCPNDCAHQLLERVVYNKTPLFDHWAGWRMAGRMLVSPDGDRISPERLRGILFREKGLARIAKAKKTRPQRPPAHQLPAREQFEGCA